MSKMSIIEAEIEPQLKADVEEIFQELGLTTTEAIALFYQQVALHKRLPFSANIPNKITEETFEKTDRGEDLVSCQNAGDMFEKIGI